MNASVGRKISGEKTEIEIWMAAGRAGERTIECWFVGASPIHAVLDKSGRGMKLGQDPLIISLCNGVSRFGCDLEIGGGIGVFVKLCVLKIVADNVAVFLRKFVLGKIDMRTHSFAECGLDFLKSECGRSNQARPGKRQPRRFTRP